MRLFLIASFVVNVAAGCGGGSTASAPETLTCAWVGDPDNCWNHVLVMAQTCLPPANDTGVLNANNSTCTYATGEVVTFTPPVVLPPATGMISNFTITGADGQQCLRYTESGASLTLVVANQTLTDTPYGSMGIRLTCADGSSVQTANISNVCPDLGGFPTIGWFPNGTSVSAVVTGTGATALAVFNCSK